MNYVTTNLRFPKDEYEDIKKIAFVERRSIASVIREAARRYKEQKLYKASDKIKLFNLMAKSRIKIDIPTSELVRMGRKFEF